jgi:hypothetical protein
VVAIKGQTYNILLGEGTGRADPVDRTTVRELIAKTRCSSG